MKKTKSKGNIHRGVKNNKKSTKVQSEVSENKKKSKLRNKIFAQVKGKDGKILPVVKKEALEDKGSSGPVSKELKRAVTNIKASKNRPSSNWAAFKEGGLHLVKPKPKPASDFKGVFRKKRKMIANDTAVEGVSDKETKFETTVDNIDLDDSYIKDLLPPEEKSMKTLTRYIAIDCEMVGVGDGKESALARVSLVNQHGVCVYDKFVKTKEEVVDYRTKVSGVRPGDLALGEELEVVQREVAEIVQGRVLVGHALTHDLRVLFLSHPPAMTRDTSKFRPFRDMFDGRNPALRKLADKVLGVKIQDGEHSSVEDAKATMQLYNLYQKEWEEHRKQRAIAKKEKMLKIKDAKKHVSKSGISNTKISRSGNLFPNIDELNIGKHKVKNLEKKDKSQKRVAVTTCTMPDEYVAF